MSENRALCILKEDSALLSAEAMPAWMRGLSLEAVQKGRPWYELYLESQEKPTD